MKVSDLYERRSFCDPAGGKSSVKMTTARSAIVTVGQDIFSRVFVLDAWAGRVDTTIITETVFKMNRKWNPQRFGIEADGQQSLYVDTVKQMAHIKKERINIEPIKHSTRENKPHRIRVAIQPLLAEGRLFIRRDLVELYAELAGFPTGQTIDLVDALASAVTMLPVVVSEQEKLDGRVLYEEYLRQCGLSREDIEKRIKSQFDDDKPAFYNRVG